MTNYREITEKMFQSQVMGLAQLCGWETLHVSHSPQMSADKTTIRKYTTPTHGTMGKGWPDLVLVRQKDRRLIVAELKSEIGRLSPEQERVLEVLRSLDWRSTGVAPLIDSTTVEVYVWRPHDIDEIARILS